MTCSYREVDLTENAIRHIIQYLNYGHQIDKELLANVDINDGKVTAFLPENIDFSRAIKFESGYIANSKKSLSCIVDVIMKFLSLATNRICILADSTSSPADARMYGFNSPMLLLNEEVYYYITSNMIDYNTIRMAIIESEQPNFFVCILTSFPEGTIFPCLNGIITIDEMRLSVKRTEMFIVSAYDGEGYLIWSKKGDKHGRLG